MNSRNSVLPGCGYHHVAIRATDFDATMRFYTEGFGFRPAVRWGEGDGRAVLLDFNLALFGEESAPFLAGTLPYMAPEQLRPVIAQGGARDAILDERTDIFSLGVVLYELVAGRAPFESGTMNDVIAGILLKDPLPLVRYSPEVPAELERIVAKALHKDREQRYQTAKDLQLELKRLAKETDIATMPMDPSLN